jgi:tRNA A37 threonylcarbamoyladenosine modification protein TsaB
VISNAGRDQFYYAYYERDRKDLHTKLAPCLGTLEEICQKLPQRPCWLVGPEAEKIRTRIQSDSPALAEKLQALSKTPSAEDVLRVAAPAIEHGGMAWPEIQPLYIRRTQAEENQAGHQHG